MNEQNSKLLRRQKEIIKIQLILTKVLVVTYFIFLRIYELTDMVAHAFNYGLLHQQRQVDLCMSEASHGYRGRPGLKKKM